MAASAPAYPALYVFGGSLSDVGNDFADDGGTAPVAPYYDGRFSNGPLWIEDYAAQNDMPEPTASLLGGTDFAFAGARTGAADLPSTGHDLPQEFASFTQQVPNPISGALYTVAIGANDISAILATGAAIPALEAMVAASVQAEMAFIGDLAARGATNFLMLNVPDLGKSPGEISRGPVAAADASTLTAYYNAEAEQAVIPLAIADHLNLDLVDTYGLIDGIVATPAAYGFTNVTDPVWTGNASNPDSGTLAATTLAGQDQYLFFDQLHPTESGSALIAAAAENVVFR